MMRTTLDIDENLLKTALELTKAKTKREVVNRSLEELIRIMRIQELISAAGTMDGGMTHEELMRWRTQSMIGRHWREK